MGTDYDRLYRETPHAPGAPNADVARFFTGLGGPVKVLDIGCGQGRDALALARAGHRVHGVDLSPAGIAQMLQEAEAEGLPLTGEVADITEWTPAGAVDVLLIDRTLHMLPGEATRIRVLAALLPAVRPGGWLLLLDEPSNMAAFRDCLGPGWRAEFRGTPRHKDRPETGTLLARRTG